MFSISCCLPPYSSPQNKCKKQDRQQPRQNTEYTKGIKGCVHLLFLLTTSIKYWKYFGCAYLQSPQGPRLPAIGLRTGPPSLSFVWFLFNKRSTVSFSVIERQGHGKLVIPSYKWPFINTLSTNPGVKVVPSAQVQVDGWPPEPQRFLDNGTMSGCVKSLKTVWLDMHWLL